MSVNQNVIDIDNYVPFSSVAEIYAFCNPDDGLMKEKKAALKERIYASGDTSSAAAFTAGIVNALFGPALLGTHKWPFRK